MNGAAVCRAMQPQRYRCRTLPARGALALTPDRRAATPTQPHASGANDPDSIAGADQHTSASTTFPIARGATEQIRPAVSCPGGFRTPAAAACRAVVMGPASENLHRKRHSSGLSGARPEPCDRGSYSTHRPSQDPRSSLRPWRNSRRCRPSRGDRCDQAV
jgi:hypothetical protein